VSDKKWSCRELEWKVKMNRNEESRHVLDEGGGGGGGV